jgi:tRNA(fMet)-specific endonuclease VapC
METFADLKSRLEMEGKRLDDFDLLIASTALALNYRLVTNNERHFRRIPGLEIENWSKG